MNAKPTPPRHKARSGWPWGALIGGSLGFALGWGLYSFATPILESTTGLARELQGLAWNLVPALTIVGAILGGLLVVLLRRK